MQNDIKRPKRYRSRYNAETLGKKLKRARIEKGMSQRALCERTDVPQAQLSRIERGLVNFSVETMVQLARALGLEPMLVPAKLVPTVAYIIRPHPEGPLPRMHMPDGDEDDDDL